MFCTIWYHLYNLKNVKYPNGGVSLFVKLKAFSLQLYSKKHSPTVFFTFFKLHKWYQISQRITMFQHRKALQSLSLPVLPLKLSNVENYLIIRT